MSIRDILDISEIECNYLIVHTGYTSRLIETFEDPSKRVFDFDEVSTVVFIKDQLLGNMTNEALDAWASWTTEEESAKIRAMLIALDIDGVIVLRLDGKPDNGKGKGSPFFACRCFFDEFGSKSENRYCGLFEGMPDKVSFFELGGLGTVVYMSFDTESG